MKKYSLKRTAALAGAIMMLFTGCSKTETVHAETPIENVDYSQSTVSTQIPQRQLDSEEMHAYICDNETENVSVEQVAKTVELCKYINEQAGPSIERCNVSFSEIIYVLNNIDRIYDEYLQALMTGNEAVFIETYKHNQAALNTLTLFECHTLQNKVSQYLTDISSINFDGISPNTISNTVTSDGIVLTFGYQDHEVTIALQGEDINTLVSCANFLNAEYQSGMNAMTGEGDDASFGYVGVSKEDGTSVYMSLGDTERLDQMDQTIAALYQIYDNEITTIQTGDNSYTMIFNHPYTKTLN